MQAFVVAQSLLEYGALGSKSGSGGGIEMVRYRLESYIGEGNAPWFLGALLVLAALAFMFRRRWSARG